MMIWSRRNAVLIIFSVILLVMIELSSSNDHSTVNKDAIERNRRRLKKRRAISEAKRAFREDNQIVFDSYGRVMRWPREPKDVICKDDLSSCKVSSHEERKYRTDEEENLQAMIRLDKQAELDREAGSESSQDQANRRRKIENRKRCKLYRDWLEKYKETSSDDRRTFFKWLEYSYADFEKLRNLPLSRSSLRKAKKLYRHIALQIHTDKLPMSCRGDEMKDMMVSILENAEKQKECISEPHACIRDEL
jgi:hypothetical protein